MGAALPLDEPMFFPLGPSCSRVVVATQPIQGGQHLEQLGGDGYHAVDRGELVEAGRKVQRWNRPAGWVSPPWRI